MKKPKKRPPTRPVAARPLPRRRWLLTLAGILAVTFLVYLPSLDNDFTNWDDNFYVADNPLIYHPSVHAILTTPVAGNYHPLTIWSFAWNYRLSGLNPASYHWFNLLLHLANTVLVFVFIQQLSRNRFWATLVTSLFFGIHPMHVESVAWIAERKDVLYTFFYLLALIAYLQYVDRRRFVWLGAALGAAILSLASKPAALVLPLSLLAIDFYRRRPHGIRILLEKAPFLAASIADGFLSLQAQQATGAMADARPWTLVQRLMVASYGALMYIAKLFIPIRLSAIYPHPNVAGTSMGPEYTLALVLLAILLPAFVFLFRRHRAILFGVAFFFINIVLVLQFFRVGGALMADRYSYLPYVGLLFAFAWWLDEHPARGSAGAFLKPALAGCFLLLAPLSLVQTWKRCDVWQNSETLWNDTIGKYPRQIYDAYINRGHYYHRKVGRLDAALADFDQAIALNPKAPTGWLDKGNLLAERGQLDSAYACLERALAIDPNITDAHNNRGVIRMRRGDLKGAIADFSRTIDLNPRYGSAYGNRALAYSKLGEQERAIADYRRLLELDPTNADPHAQIGIALHQLRRFREAIAEYDEALRLAPQEDRRLGEYYLYRSYAWAELGDRSRALDDAREAQRRGVGVDPSFLRRLGA